MAYTGKKVEGTVFDTSKGIVASVWMDAKKGYYKGLVSRKKIYGSISEVLLDRNALILKPYGINRLLNSGLQEYIIYIVNPGTMQPMVSVSLS